MARPPGFVERHGLWTGEQAARAAELPRLIEREDLHLIRVAWADTHGVARAKALSPAAFGAALREGHNINVATATLDASGGRVFASFTRGGGMGLDEMTGSPNLIHVPDPATFRVLPWAPGVGWVLGDEYFRDGRPFPFSTRHLLKRQIARLDERAMRLIVGLEVEWHLARTIDDRIGPAETSHQGRPARPVPTAPAEPGFAYHAETNLDLMQPVLSELVRVYRALDLELRSIENEFGPGQVECTFAAVDAMRAADDYILFRTATRQVCRRLGHFASFMCRPAFEGFFASGWHLHQSLADRRTGRNLFMPDDGAEILGPPGRSFLAGLIAHAGPAASLAAPTVNGYSRFRANSLAPDRATWGFDHRGAMVRVLGGPGDPATRLENRAAEPAANPYLFIASQIAAGLDGIERGLVPPPADDEPYAADRPKLPGTLEAAIGMLEGESVFRDAFGAPFVDYFIALKRAEIDRFAQACQNEGAARVNGVTQWEQNEYYDFF